MRSGAGGENAPRAHRDGASADCGGLGTRRGNLIYY
jgi:hypothetical protein